MSIKVGENGIIGDFIPSAVAGEDISAGEPMFVALGTENIPRYLSLGSGVNQSLTTWRAQSFLTHPTCTKVVSVTLYIADLSQSNSVTARLRSSLTGSDLASATWTATSSGPGPAYVNFSFDVAATGNTVYYVVVSGTSTHKWVGSATSVYASGSAHQSSDSGASWAADSGVADYYLAVTEDYTVAGKVYKAIDQMADNFVGFARDTVSAEGTAYINPQMVITGLSGLTAGQRYYLSTTPGSLATSGSYLVGIALNSTTLIRQYENEEVA